MKKQLLCMMLAAGALLVGCQSNLVEPTEEVTITERDADEIERQQQAHIDEIRRSINGDQEEMTTEEYFKQQREEKREEIRKSAENWREYNDIITHGFPDSKEEKEKPREKTYLETISEIRGETIKRGLSYENFLMVGDSDFDSLSEVNQLFGQGELIGERENIRQYRWTSGKGSSYKVVQIVFVDGKVESKVQSGLK